MIPALPGHDWPALIERVLAVLPEPGWVVLPDALPADLVAALREELVARDAAGVLHAAGIGRGAAHQVRGSVRGDRIAWLQASWPAAARYLSLMDSLRQALNQSLFLGLDEYEAHYACYEPGGFYRRHVDRHAGGADGQGQRVISTVCYLNEPGWPADAGGELLLHPEGHDDPVRVRPEGGTLLVFRSDNLPHEVLAANRQRLSIAGWMRTRGD